MAVESGCDSSVVCRSDTLNQRTVAERADVLNTVEKCLKTMGLRNGDERWRMVNKGGQK